MPVAPMASEVPTRQPAARNWLAIGGIAVLAAVAIVLVAGAQSLRYGAVPETQTTPAAPITAAPPPAPVKTAPSPAVAAVPPPAAPRSAPITPTRRP